MEYQILLSEKIVDIFFKENFSLGFSFFMFFCYFCVIKLKIIYETERFISLDVVRGLTVVGMIMVNNGYGDTFGMLRHAEWNGLSISDFVFPFFLFIMGVFPEKIGLPVFG